MDYCVLDTQSMKVRLTKLGEVIEVNMAYLFDILILINTDTRN